MVGLLVSMVIGIHGGATMETKRQVRQIARKRGSAEGSSVGLIINQGARRESAGKGVDEFTRRVYILVGVKLALEA